MKQNKKLQLTVELKLIATEYIYLFKKLDLSSLTLFSLPNTSPVLLALLIGATKSEKRFQKNNQPFF